VEIGDGEAVHGVWGRWGRRQLALMRMRRKGGKEWCDMIRFGPAHHVAWQREGPNADRGTDTAEMAVVGQRDGDGCRGGVWLGNSSWASPMEKKETGWGREERSGPHPRKRLKFFCF
jgi:hypothetical protein